jgi:hypothetical protein
MRNLQMVVVDAPMQNLLLGEPDLLRTGFNAKAAFGFSTGAASYDGAYISMSLHP